MITKFTRQPVALFAQKLSPIRANIHSNVTTAWKKRVLFCAINAF